MKINVFMKWYLVLLLLLMFQSQPLYAQKCDSQLKPVENKAIQYRARKNRCEGFYDRNVLGLGGELAVVGLTEGDFRFELRDDEVVTLSAPLAADQEVSIRATAIPVSMYYRLDAQLTAKQPSLAWPVADVLLPMKLASDNVGVFGWIGTEDDKIYVPVLATPQRASVAQDGTIRLVVRASDNVSNVQWRTGVMQQGTTAGLSDWNKMPKSSYWAGEPMVITLPASATGELYVEVSAQLQGTDEWLSTLSMRVLVRR